MIRGRLPYVAIAEAALKAEKHGMTALVLEIDQEQPIHIVLCDGPCVSFIRVRRMKYPRYSTTEIAQLCKNDIAALREIGVTEEVFRELWVRGSDKRRWRRYLILPDAIEELDGFDDDGDRKPVKGKASPSPPAVFAEHYELQDYGDYRSKPRHAISGESCFSEKYDSFVS